MLFLNVKGAVHSVTPRVEPGVRRRSINIIGQDAGRERMWRIAEHDSRFSRVQQLQQRVQCRLRRLVA